MTKHTHGRPIDKGHIEYDDSAPHVIVKTGMVDIKVTPVLERPEMVLIEVGRLTQLQVNGMFLAAALRDMLKVEPFETAIPEAE